MRSLVVNPADLRRIVRHLEEAREVVVVARDSVVAPEGDYPWHALVEEGLSVLLHATDEVLTACRRVGDGIEDSLGDFWDLDGHVAVAAELRR